MKRIAFLLGSALSLGGGLLLAAGPAQAGACSGEIMALQQQLTSTPTMASGSHIAPGATPPSTLSADAGPAPLPAAGAAVPAPGADPGGGGKTAHAVPNGSGEAGSTPGSDPQPLPDANGGVLAQGDNNVPAPAQTEPMDEDQTQSGEVMPDANSQPDEAAKALARARAFDQVGDEAACMNAVEEAKSQLGEQ